LAAAHDISTPWPGQDGPGVRTEVYRVSHNHTVSGLTVLTQYGVRKRWTTLDAAPSSVARRNLDCCRTFLKQKLASTRRWGWRTRSNQSQSESHLLSSPPGARCPRTIRSIVAMAPRFWAPASRQSQTIVKLTDKGLFILQCIIIIAFARQGCRPGTCGIAASCRVVSIVSFFLWPRCVPNPLPPGDDGCRRASREAGLGSVNHPWEGNRWQRAIGQRQTAAAWIPCSAVYSDRPPAWSLL